MTDQVSRLLQAAANTLTDPHWNAAPGERDPNYFWTWQRVSLALQRWMRDRLAEDYFRDAGIFEDRAASYPVIVYQASRLCHGRPRTEFTYDLRDYPECYATLESAWKLTGRAIQAVLSRIERRLCEAGMTELAHRYAPVWHQDVLVAVKKKPQSYVDLLVAESAVINATIDLGTERSAAAAHRFARTAHLNLRKLYGMDLQVLGHSVLQEATRMLAQNQAGGVEDLRDRRPLQNGNVRATGSPDAGIGGKEDGDDGRAHSGCEVGDAGVVTDVNAGAGDPAGQIV
jgi:hypothetical protein